MVRFHYISVILIGLTLTYCGAFRDDFFCATATVTVNPAFSIAPDWNDYVPDVAGVDVFDEDPSALCPAGNPCLHSGELRKVDSKQTSCSNLSMTDSLGAFHWECVVGSDGNAAFFSTALASQKGLKNLVDASAWKKNSVAIRNSKTGCTVAKSASTTWWNNPVTPPPSL